MLVDGRAKESSALQSKEIEGNFIKEESVEKLTEKKTFVKKMTCFNCGGEFPHTKRCPAKGKQCEKCFRYNHFSSCCRENNPRKFRDARQNSNLRQMQSRNVSQSESSSSEENLFLLDLSKKENEKPKTNVTINGKKVKMTVDTGASINVIDEETFKQFKGVTLQKTYVKAFTYGSKNPVRFLGKFTAVIETRRSITAADIYVIKDKDSGCLLSCSTAQALRLITLHLDTVSSQYSKREEKVEKYDVQLVNILERHGKVFKGLGKLKGSKVTLNIDNTIRPVSLKQRRVPFHIRKKVSEALKKLSKDDIIEKVPDNQPTPWVSPIVAVPQSDNTIRLCVDMRQPNLAIKRTRHPIPTTSDIDVTLNGACFFSKLDVRQAFHQVELDEASRHITTFTTHKGLFRYKRLNFGTNVASELFQNLLEKHLCDGIKNIHDDIIVFGKTRHDHDVALDNCLQRLSEIGLTLNRKKCAFLQPELAFFGHVYSKEGIRPDMKRINDIIDLERPSNIREVRSFLGMLNYCSKFIEDFSTLTAPLRELTKKQTKFIWNESHEAAFEQLKCKLTSVPVMSYFDVDKETELCVDASPFGLSAILMQRDADSENPRIIAYGSRSLSMVEQKYSQTEREALAIVWGVEHFHQYVYGSQFTIITDHKPLEVIYGQANSKPSARIERWVLRLQPYNFNVRYRNGKDNPADYMSRHPSMNTSGDQETYTELYINFITKHSIPRAMTRNEIVDATKIDNISILLKKAIVSNNWEDQRLVKFLKMKKEFSLTNDGIILRGAKIFIPHKLRGRAISIAHESHQGLEKTTLLLREKVWFPKMDDMVSEVVRTCVPCIATGKDVPPEPIKMTQMPNAPWEKLHLDFKGPLPGGKYLLVVIDRYSRYPEVEIIASTNASTVIRKLNKVFASHGIPEILVTDNGPPFRSKDFTDYVKEIGTSHQLATPYWPQGNAEAERFMRTLGKTLAIAHLSNEDLQTALSRFLFLYRTTPHITTKVPPAELLYNRNVRGKIPSENPTKVDKHHIARRNEEKSKLYNKRYADNRRRTRENEINVGDSVLVKQKLKNKLMTKFCAEPCIVINVTGPEVTVQTKDGKYMCRNKSFIKKVPVPRNTSDSEDDEYRSCTGSVVNDTPVIIPAEGAVVGNYPNSSTSVNTEEVQSSGDIRSSSRVSRPPERYGFPVPSEIIENSS